MNHKKRLWSLGVVAAACVGEVAGQSAPPQERIEVTGSHLKRVDQESPAPVTVISRKDIERTAAQSMSELLTTLPYATSSFTEAHNFGNSFAPATSGVGLHGLGPKSTLVLLDGRRIAPYAFAQDISVNFVDLSAIPLSAIERVEILRDGASAIYGSDAVAGVVNIILRRDFMGLEGRASYSASDHGDAHETRGNMVAGWGNVASDRYNATVSLDYHRREPLFGRDRDSWDSTTDTRPWGGIDLRNPAGFPGTWLTGPRLGQHTPFPGCPSVAANICVYDTQRDVMTLAEVERMSLFARGAVELRPNVTAYAQALLSSNRSRAELAATPDGFTLPVGRVSNPFPFAVPIYYRFTDVGPRRTKIEADSHRVVAGLLFSTGGWDWDAAFVDSAVDVMSNQENFISFPVRDSLVARGIYDFVDRRGNDPALVESLRASPWRRGKSGFRSWDAKVAGTLAALPGGPIGVGAGVERRRETLLDERDDLSRAGLIIGAGGTAVTARRDVDAAFVEAFLPFTRRVEVQLAARHERYSDAGSATVPKVAVAMRPVESLLLRAGYNRGFRAPSLPESQSGLSTSFLTLTDSLRCSRYRAAFGNDSTATRTACTAASYLVSTSGNRDLDPERSEAVTGGFVWDVGTLSVALDAYRIKYLDRVQTLSHAYLLQNEARFPSQVFRLPPTADDLLAGAPGALAGGPGRTANDVAVANSWFNAARAEARGVDLELQARTNLADWGRLTWASANNYVDALEFSDAPGQPTVSRAGNGVGWPRYRGAHSLRWNGGPWEALAVVQVIGRHFVPGSGSFPPVDVDTWTTVDLQASYSGLRDLTLTAGVRNALDREPPFGLAANLYSFAGRTLYGRVFYRFR